MPAPKALKKLARSLGVYPLARRLYRRFSSEIRVQTSNDLAVYRQMIRPGDLVFDIGCNLGQKATIFRELGARVVALEPNPNCVPTLRLEFGDDPDFILLGKAVGAAPGTATLNFANTISTASLRDDWHGLAYRDGDLQKLEVEVTTLDALIARYGDPAFCKIDVEGFEAEVLKGLGRPLKMLSLEYHRDEPEQALACLDILARLGPLRINAIEIDGGTLLFERWRTLDELRQWFASGEVPRAGDLFVESAGIA